MFEPILNLAFALHNKKGIYALLLGSGVSRSAGIYTGWEILIDLIKKLAKLRNEDCEPNPEAWYKTRYGEDPNYSKIINSISKTQAERSQLLKQYFEPSIEEREQGLKQPTYAHKSIVHLVSKGYIKIILTTNFDHLIENSIREEGINPLVISTPDAIEGMLPLPNVNCLVLKLNGDYLDTRIKNTPDELEKYDDRMNQLLERIFDDYGLIICGWSSEWDIALRKAIERCKSFRFTTFWTCKETPQGNARNLIDLRRAEIINIKDADNFFLELENKVIALEDLDSQHPISSKVAIAILKRLLPLMRYFDFPFVSSPIL